MNISQLLQSTSYVKGYGASSTFSNKPFGAIYAYNKIVRVKPKSSIIEVSMMIKAVTDRIKPARESASRPVAAHKVMVAIRGVEQEVVTADQLVDLMRQTIPAYRDEEAFPREDVLQRAIDPSKKAFEGKTVMVQANGTYVIIKDQISKDNDIRVWCSCSSYYWVFQYYNVDNNVDIFGKYPQKYIPKTKKGLEAFKKNQPMRNPGKHPGMCKHIMLLLAMLMDTNTVSEARSVTKNYRANIARFDRKDRITPEEYDKLMKDYTSDHRRKLQQRDMYRGNVGFADIAESQRSNKFTGWNRDFKWNPNKGHWR